MCSALSPRICLGCGIEYTPKRKDAIACSGVCSTKARSKKTASYKKEWKAQNKDKVKKANSKYRETHIDFVKVSNNRYRESHKSYFANYASLRNRHVLMAQPKWSDPQDLLAVYEEARYMGLEVDHIVPIKHPLVCGLHVWDNLQLLSRTENAKKSNYFVVN